ncbi:MAG: sensor histidine kinase [Flavisolibacter sp.]
MDSQTPENTINSLSFKIDSGLIDRLGRELVGRAETAVSELIKNSYDADAKQVKVEFIETNQVGGTLIIDDDGLGMSIDQLQDGFMTISSTDKIHNPVSERYQRRKAGRKGIGRFATQRLGQKLTIITQKLENEVAIKLTVEWDNYQIDTELTEIKNPVEYISKIKPEGTTLIIDGLREWWSEADIRRVYRYVSDLLQPDYISDRSQSLGLAKQSDETFQVSFFQIIGDVKKVVADPKKMLFEKALVKIEGYVDSNHDGYCFVESQSLGLEAKDILKILHNKVYEEDIEEAKKLGNNIKKITLDSKYRRLDEVHFKVYYFIYNRNEYYTSITKTELTSIQKLANEQGGIRLYRNGFRVLPYGEPNDDWLDIDRRWSGASGATNVPFSNRNLFGFVEIIDPTGKLFQETASREGLINNEHFKELTDFLNKALTAARTRIAYAIKKIRKEPNTGSGPQTASEGNGKTTIQKLNDLEKNVTLIIGSSEQTSTSQNLIGDTKRIVNELKSDILLLLDELGMVRVLAGLGLTIGEFTHEVIQFSPSIMGDLSVLSNQKLNTPGINSLENLKRTIQIFISYTSYFNATVSANVSRELKPQDIEKIVKHFKSVLEGDLAKLNIEFSIEPYGYDIFTIPMHTSEWSSILFNLYTNSKKAIKRNGVQGKIKVIVGKEDSMVYLEFLDNGDGIPEENRKRIFDAFFTTSSPMGFESTEDEKLTGTGLGLKIVKDIVQAYGGTIDVVKPESGYSTCFRIELPMVSQKQKEEYGL